MSEGSIEIPVTIKNAGFRTGLEGMSQDAKKFAHEVGHNVGHKLKEQFEEVGKALVGAFALEKLFEFGRGIMELGHKIESTSERLEMSVEAVQGLGFAFAQGGADSEHFERGMVKLNQSLEAARLGNIETIEAFERLGLTWDDISTKNPEQILYLIADGMHNATDHTAALAAVMTLLGKQAAKLVPTLREGSEELKHHSEEAKKLSEEEVKDLAEAEKWWERWYHNIEIAVAKAGLAIEKHIRSMKKVSDMIADAKAENGPATQEDIDFHKHAQETHVPPGAHENQGEAFGPAAPEDPRAVKAREEAAKVEEKAAERRAELAKDIAKLEEEAHMAGLTAAQQALELMERRAVLMQQLATTDDGSEARLQTEKDILEISKRIREQTEKAYKERDAKQAKIDGLRERGNKEDEHYALSKMSKEEQVKFLKEKQAGVVKEANAALKKGDMETYEKKANEAREYRGEIDRAETPDADKTKEGKGKLASVSVSALQRVGGGGGIGGASDPHLRAAERQNALTERVARAVETIAGKTEQKPHADFK